MKTHDLKCWPSQFQAVVEGRKKFELRVNDRDYRDGDKLVLREWFPAESRYTGRVVLADVTHLLLGGNFGLPENMVVMSIALEGVRIEHRPAEREGSR